MSMVKVVKIDASMGEGFTVSGNLGGHEMFIDQPKDMGGQNKGPTPLQYLEFALAGCVASIGRIVAMQKKLPVRGMTVNVEGSLNLAKLMGQGGEGRVGFVGFHVVVDIDADMSDAEKEAFLHEVDSRCPVSDNLIGITPVTMVLKK